MTGNIYPPDPPRNIYAKKHIQALEMEGLQAVSRAGGLPIMLPETGTPSDAEQMIELIDGLILTGGADVAPQTYHEKPISERWPGDPKRDAYELRLIDLALKAKKPILGLCRGCQILNVYFGGTLYQDITSQKPGTLLHRDVEKYDHNNHFVSLEENGLLFPLYNKARLKVNSVHHQAVKDLGKGLKASAISEDGLIEAVELARPLNSFLLGVQWHPEWEGNPKLSLDDGQKIMAAFLEKCRGTS